MRKQLQLATATVIVSMFLAGCMNMPTPPSQITGTHVSELKYQDYSYAQLAAELDSLARRENQLVVAQEQRRKTSKVQAFWYGFGQGDGIEASELANVRGEKEAVRRAMEARKSASSAVPETKPQVDASGRVIVDYKAKKDASGEFVRDKDGHFVLVPVYQDEQEK